jgi:hypothetical protein
VNRSPRLALSNHPPVRRRVTVGQLREWLEQRDDELAVRFEDSSGRLLGDVVDELYLYPESPNGPALIVAIGPLEESEGA